MEVLSRGLSFCPSQNFDLFEVVTDLHLFARKVMLKCQPETSNTDIDTTDWSEYSMHEFKALQNLTLLFQESNTSDLIDQLDLDKLFEEVNKTTQNPITLFKKPSTKFLPLNTSPSVAMFLKQTKDICRLSCRKNNP